MAKVVEKYTVIRDTREQVGWTFSKDSWACDGTTDGTLQTGDYSLVGYEDKLSIERKRNTSEWSGNVFQARFIRELERLSKFRYAYIVLEFLISDITEFPKGSGIPPYMYKRLKMTPQLLLKKTIELMDQFPSIKFIFAGDKGRHFCSSLFKRVVEFEAHAKQK